MSSIYDSRQRLKYLFILIATLIAIVSVFVSDKLVKSLAQEERQKVEIWAEAQRMIATETNGSNMALILKILESNTTIPVLWCNEKDSVIAEKNIDLPEKDSDLFLKNKVRELKSKNPPILIDMQDGTFQYLYYDDSIILKRLLIYPYAQLTVVFIFILIAFLALASTKKAEQNKVWVGLSKETAHQLGTPISSLMAWTEYLQASGVDSEITDEIDKDVKRLSVIADRFSKIGSQPEMQLDYLNEVVAKSLDYMKSRVSGRVVITMNLSHDDHGVQLSRPLIEWVMENLTKNAVDAMQGEGTLDITTGAEKNIVWVEVKDSGKGIARKNFKTVFNPGYTTKKRGWGLGLTLVKRIVEEYHGGKIFVKESELGKGTTFRIEFPAA